MTWLELKIPPPVYFVLCLLCMIGIDRLVPATQMALPFRPFVAWGFAILGLCFDFPAMITFFRAKTTIWPLDPNKTSSLVTSGLYRFTRNPMYLGLVFILAGAMWWLQNPLTLVMIPVFILLVTRFQILPEERALERIFGAEYDAYRQRVPRWI